MKKNRSLSSCYIGAYFIWVFGVVLAAIMFLKFGTGLMIAFFAVAVIILGAIIASHVLYNKKQFNLFIYISFAAHGLATIMILAAFILEMVLQAKGQGATYAVVMLSICLGGYLLVDLFLVLNNIKLLKKIKNNTFEENE